MEKKIFLLEDDLSICELVKCTMELSGIEVSCFNTVSDFMSALRKSQPTTVLLDIMLPDGNGLEVLSNIKKSYPKIYCIMLSALEQETDKVKGLNMGADDYIAKPFGVLELTARVNVSFRKNADADLNSAGIVIDDAQMSVTLDGKKLQLNNKEYQLLKYCMLNHDRVLTREMILDAVWGYDEGETRTVDNHIARLRKQGVDNLETVFGVGYKFNTK